MKQIAFLIFFILLIANYAHADSTTLYDELGGDQGINQFVTRAVALSHQHHRIDFLFEDTDDAELITQLSDQICQLSDGPCEYDGLDMVEAHSGMEITEAEFDIFVKLVIDAMQETGIKHNVRNKLLARLVPMRADIIYQ